MYDVYIYRIVTLHEYKVLNKPYIYIFGETSLISIPIPLPVHLTFVLDYIYPSVHYAHSKISNAAIVYQKHERNSHKNALSLC